MVGTFSVGYGAHRAMRDSRELAARKRRAAVGTVVMAAGVLTFAGVVPWLLTRWRVREPVLGGSPARVLGALLVGTGAVVLTRSFVRFVTEGAAAVAGQALWLRQPKLPLYPLAAALPVAGFVRWYEEPA